MSAKRQRRQSCNSEQERKGSFNAFFCKWKQHSTCTMMEERARWSDLGPASQITSLVKSLSLFHTEMMKSLQNVSHFTDTDERNSNKLWFDFCPSLWKWHRQTKPNVFTQPVFWDVVVPGVSVLKRHPNWIPPLKKPNPWMFTFTLDRSLTFNTCANCNCSHYCNT